MVLELDSKFARLVKLLFLCERYIRDPIHDYLLTVDNDLIEVLSIVAAGFNDLRYVRDDDYRSDPSIRVSS